MQWKKNAQRGGVVRGLREREKIIPNAGFESHTKKSRPINEIICHRNRNEIPGNAAYKSLKQNIYSKERTRIVDAIIDSDVVIISCGVKLISIK
jgi:hypothetical protein